MGVASWKLRLNSPTLCKFTFHVESSYQSVAVRMLSQLHPEKADADQLRTTMRSMAIVARPVVQSREFHSAQSR